MTKEEIEKVNNIINKTMDKFIDTFDNDDEISDKDRYELLLGINKAICNSIIALEIK